MWLSLAALTWILPAESAAGQLGGAVLTWGFSSPTWPYIPTPFPSAAPPTRLVSAGGRETTEYSLALAVDGTVWSWGANDCGQLGRPDVVGRGGPTGPVSGLSDVQSMDAGAEHGLAVRLDGTVWTWGWKLDGPSGGGDSRCNGYSAPVGVRGLPPSIAVAGGPDHSLALARNGAVWSWGQNQFGQLGVGTRTESAIPLQIDGLTDVTAVSAGGDGSSFSMALTKDGGVWQWGFLQPSQEVQVVPRRVSELPPAVAVAAGGNFSLALATDGTVWAWGKNCPWWWEGLGAPTCEYGGALGNGGLSSSATPTRVVDLKDVVAIAAGAYHSLAVTSDGRLWGWGYNYDGQIGCEPWSNPPTPLSCGISVTRPIAVAVPTMDVVSGGWAHSLGVTGGPS